MALKNTVLVLLATTPHCRQSSRLSLAAYPYKKIHFVCHRNQRQHAVKGMMINWVLCWGSIECWVLRINWGLCVEGGSIECCVLRINWLLCVEDQLRVVCWGSIECCVLRINWVLSVIFVWGSIEGWGLRVECWFV